MAIGLILLLDRRGVRVFSDRETIGPVVTLAPPAIENAEVEAAMAAGFHATGAGGFQRPARRIQPNVAARNHLPRDMHVVVLDENQMPLQIAVLAQVDDVLNVAFAILIAGMRFAGKNKLNRPLLI